MNASLFPLISLELFLDFFEHWGIICNVDNGMDLRNQLAPLQK